MLTYDLPLPSRVFAADDIPLADLPGLCEEPEPSGILFNSAI